MSDSSSRPPLLPDDALDALGQFAAAYHGIIELWDVALTSWPLLPEGWEKYAEHLATLDRHRPVVAAVLTHAGRETPAEARRIVNDIQDGCAKAKWGAEHGPRPLEKMQRLRDAVGELATPLRQFADLVLVQASAWLETHAMSESGSKGEDQPASPQPEGEPPAEVEGSAEQPTIWYHGECLGKHSYSRDGKPPIGVSNEMHNALKGFLDHDIALVTKALQDAGISNVTTVMRKLAKKFGEDAIHRPKEKGDGYFIRVRSLKRN
jgi:hypothetical protein